MCSKKWGERNNKKQNPFQNRIVFVWTRAATANGEEKINKIDAMVVAVNDTAQ